MDDDLTIEELLKQEEQKVAEFRAKFDGMRFFQQFGIKLEEFLRWPRGALPGNYVGDYIIDDNRLFENCEMEEIDLR